MQRREIAAYAKYPDDVTQYSTLVSPFGWWVWLFTAISIAAVYVFIIVVVRVDAHNNIDMDIFQIGSITCGPMIFEPMHRKLFYFDKAAALRVLLFIWLPLSCLLGMSYRGNLLAFLVKTGKEKPIDTFDDVMERDLTMYLSRSSFGNAWAKSSPIPYMQKVYDNQVRKKNGSYTFDKGGDWPAHVKQGVKEGTAIFTNIHIRAIGTRHMYREAKDAVIGLFPTGFYHAMNLPVMDKVKWIIWTLAEVGIVNKITEVDYFFDMAQPEREFYRHQVVEENKTVTLQHVLPIFLISIALVVLTVLLFLTELVVFKLSRKEQSSAVEEDYEYRGLDYQAVRWIYES